MLLPVPELESLSPHERRMIRFEAWDSESVTAALKRRESRLSWVGSTACVLVLDLTSSLNIGFWKAFPFVVMAIALGQLIVDAYLPGPVREF